MKAFDESIIIEVTAARVGEEEFSSGGIALGRRVMGEIPKHGKVISIGRNVPAVDAEILRGKTVVIPEGGRMTNVPDERVLTGEIDSSAGRQLIATHWKNISCVYGE